MYTRERSSAPVQVSGVSLMCFCKRRGPGAQHASLFPHSFHTETVSLAGEDFFLAGDLRHEIKLFTAASSPWRPRAIVKPCVSSHYAAAAFGAQPVRGPRTRSCPRPPWRATARRWAARHACTALQHTGSTRSGWCLPCWKCLDAMWTSERRCPQERVIV